jgi:hypothetical protein
MARPEQIGVRVVDGLEVAVSNTMDGWRLFAAAAAFLVLLPTACSAAGASTFVPLLGTGSGDVGVATLVWGKKSERRFYE